MFISYEGNLDLTEARNKLRELYNKNIYVKHDFRNESLYQLIARKLRGVTVLDIGCGPGHFINVAHTCGYGAIGIEKDLELIKMSKDIYPNGNSDIRLGTAETVDLGNTFDNIVMLDVLEHIKEDVQTLLRITKYLKPHGRIILVVPSHPCLYGIRDRSMGHYRRYSKKGLIKLMDDCGLSILEIRHWNALGFIPYFISEKVFKRALEVKIRELKQQKGLRKVYSRAMHTWFKYIENQYDFHFGLSLICTAERK